MKQYQRIEHNLRIHRFFLQENQYQSKTNEIAFEKCSRIDLLYHLQQHNQFVIFSHQMQPEEISLEEIPRQCQSSSSSRPFLHGPQRSPSASIDRTDFSIALRSVSSSQGLTSKTMVLLAMICSSTERKNSS